MELALAPERSTCRRFARRRPTRPQVHVLEDRFRRVAGVQSERAALSRERRSSTRRTSRMPSSELAALQRCSEGSAHLARQVPQGSAAAALAVRSFKAPSRPTGESAILPICRRSVRKFALHDLEPVGRNRSTSAPRCAEHLVDDGEVRPPSVDDSWRGGTRRRAGAARRVRADAEQRRSSRARSEQPYIRARRRGGQIRTLWRTMTTTRTSSTARWPSSGRL